jgi:hypothetical protein
MKGRGGLAVPPFAAPELSESSGAVVERRYSGWVLLLSSCFLPADRPPVLASRLSILS